MESTFHNQRLSRTTVPSEPRGGQGSQDATVVISDDEGPGSPVQGRAAKVPRSMVPEEQVPEANGGSASPAGLRPAGAPEPPQDSSGPSGPGVSSNDSSWVLVHCPSCMSTFSKANVQGDTCPNCQKDGLCSGRHGRSGEHPDRMKLTCKHHILQPDMNCTHCLEFLKIQKAELDRNRKVSPSSSTRTFPVEPAAQVVSPPAPSGGQGTPREVQPEAQGPGSASGAAESVGTPTATRPTPSVFKIYSPNSSSLSQANGLNTPPRPTTTPVINLSDSSGMQTVESQESQVTLGRPVVPKLPLGSASSRGSRSVRGRSRGADTSRHSVASSAGSRMSRFSVRSCKMKSEGCLGSGALRCQNCQQASCSHCLAPCRQCNNPYYCDECRPQQSHNCKQLVAEQKEREAELRVKLAQQEAALAASAAQTELAEARQTARSYVEIAAQESRKAELAALKLKEQEQESHLREQREQRAWADEVRAAELESARRVEQAKTGGNETARREVMEARGEAHAKVEQARRDLQAATDAAAAQVSRERSHSAQSRNEASQLRTEMESMNQAMRAREQQLLGEQQSQVQAMVAKFEAKLELERSEAAAQREADRRADRERLTQALSARSGDPGQMFGPKVLRPPKVGSAQGPDYQLCHICTQPTDTQCVRCTRYVCARHHDDECICVICRQSQAIDEQRKEEQRKQQDEFNKLSARHAAAMRELRQAVPTVPAAGVPGASAPGPSGAGVGGSGLPPAAPTVDGGDGTSIPVLPPGVRMMVNGYIVTGGVGGGGPPPPPPPDGGNGAAAPADGHKDNGDNDYVPVYSPTDDGGYPDPGGTAPTGGASGAPGGSDPSGGSGGAAPGAGSPGGGAPGAPAGAPPPGGGPPPDGGNGATVVPGLGGVQYVFMGNSNQDKYTLTALPGVGELEEWKVVNARGIAGTSRNVSGCFAWIQAAFDTDEPEEQLKVSGDQFSSLDMRIATDIIGKAQTIRNKPSGINRVVHDLASAILMKEQQCRAEVPTRLMTGREMIRLIVLQHAVRSTDKQLISIIDLTQIKFNASKAESDAKFPAFFDIWRVNLAKAAPNIISHDFKMCVLEHFYDQIREVPMLQSIVDKFWFCTDPPTTGERTYEWLVQQILVVLERRRLDRNRQDQLKAFRDALNKKPAAPAVPGPPRPPPTTPRAAPKSAAEKKKMPCRYFAMGSCKKGDKCDYSHAAVKGGGKGDKNKGRPRPTTPRATPGPPAPPVAAPPAPPPAAPAQSAIPCFAFSRGSCRNKNCNKAHRPLTAQEREKRDKWEKELVDAGKPVPYDNVPKALAAPPKVTTPRAKSKAKAKGSGKGVCHQWQRTGRCSLGDACQYKHTK